MYVSTPDRAKSGEPIQHRFTSTSSGSQCMPVCGDGFRIEPAASRKFRAGPFQGGLTARLRLGPAAEECDDGNNLVSAPASRGEREPRRCLWEAGDGCDPVCQVEVGWRTKVQATPPPPPHQPLELRYCGDHQKHWDCILCVTKGKFKQTAAGIHLWRWTCGGQRRLR